MVQDVPVSDAPVGGKQPHRYAVVSGSLGVGNLGDDALLAAFLAQHGHAYHGISVLSAERTREVPGVWMLNARERGALPDSLSVLRLAAMGGRLGALRSLKDRLRVRLTLETLADGAPIDYVWLGGLLGQAPHITLRSRELSWASSFASRLVYYFGDAEVLPDAHVAARELASKWRDMPSFVAVRSTAAAEELTTFGFPAAQVGTDAVLFQYGDAIHRVPKAPGLRLVISPCNAKVGVYRPLWLGMAKAAIRRDMSVEWVSLCDPHDLSLCEALHSELSRGMSSEGRATASIVVRSSAALRSLRTATATVATRFHAHIFSVCFGIPTLSVSYARKTQRLFDDLGLADWRLSPERADDASQYQSLLDRALDGRFIMPEGKIAEIVRSHQRVVTAFANSL